MFKSLAWLSLTIPILVKFKWKVLGKYLHKKLTSLENIRIANLSINYLPKNRLCHGMYTHWSHNSVIFLKLNKSKINQMPLLFQSVDIMFKRNLNNGFIEWISHSRSSLCGQVQQWLACVQFRRSLGRKCYVSSRNIEPVILFWNDKKNINRNYSCIKNYYYLK